MKSAYIICQNRGMNIVTEKQFEVRCPKCGSTSYSIKYRESTALAVPEVYIDGKLLSSRDPNYHTAHCNCLNCGANFTSTIHYDSIDSQLDSYQPDVKNIEVIADAARKAFVASAEEMRKYEIQRLKERIEKLQQELQELEMKDGFLSSVELKPDTYKVSATRGE